MVAGTNTTVLITGETGTGKELVARAIHEASPRARAAAASRSTAPRSRAEPARERAVRPREGRVHRRGRAAQGPLRAGARRHAVPRRDRRAAARAAGQAAARAAGARVRARRRHRDASASTCASSRRPTATSPQMVARRQFREDLYYRLNVFPIDAAAAARARRRHPAAGRTSFLRRFARQARQAHRRRLARGDAARCARYDWPGNVRELQNVIERAVILARRTVLDVDALPDLSPSAVAVPMADDGGGRPDARGPSPRSSAGYVEQVLAETNWVIEGERGAARRLGLAPEHAALAPQALGCDAPAERKLAVHRRARRAHAQTGRARVRPRGECSAWRHGQKRWQRGRDAGQRRQRASGRRQVARGGGASRPRGTPAPESEVRRRHRHDLQGLEDGDVSGGQGAGRGAPTCC